MEQKQRISRGALIADPESHARLPRAAVLSYRLSLWARFITSSTRFSSRTPAIWAPTATRPIAVVFPLTVVALAIAVMVGDGCCAFVSISLGRQDGKKASRSVGNAVLLCVAASLILTAVYLIFADQIIAMFGGTVNEETFLHSQEYFFYITIGIPLYMFGQAMNPVIRADGSPRFAMVSTLAGAAANIILDPFFIFCFRWGMMGAAVATVIGQAVTAVLAVWYLCHMKIVKLSKQDFRLDGAVCGRTLGLGITSFPDLSRCGNGGDQQYASANTGALDEIFRRRSMRRIPMAVVGIVMKFFQIVISIVVGMAAGCIRIVGFNMGAGLKPRVKALFYEASHLGGTRGLCGASSGGVLFPQTAHWHFGAANESAAIRTFAIRAFRCIFACCRSHASTKPASSSCRRWARRAEIDGAFHDP